MPPVTWFNLYHLIGRPPGVTATIVASALTAIPGLFQAEDLGFAALGAVTLGIGVPVAGTAALTAAGFTGAGIAASSIAAGVQAGIGNVAAGSLFATLQSVGATGGLAILGPFGVAGALIGTCTVGGIALFRRQRAQRNARRTVQLHVIYPHV